MQHPEGILSKSLSEKSVQFSALILHEFSLEMAPSGYLA
jgi:hypothetical protein